MHYGARAARFRDARDAARPAIANAGHRASENASALVVSFSSRMRRIHLRTPARGVAAAAQMRELEMRVAVTSRASAPVGEMHGAWACGVGTRHSDPQPRFVRFRQRERAPSSRGGAVTGMTRPARIRSKT